MAEISRVVLLGAIACVSLACAAESSLEERVALVKGSGFFNELATEQDYTEAASHLSVEMADLNGDGAVEFVIALEQSDYCGSMGCAFEVLQKSPNGYRVLLDGTVNGGAPEVRVGDAMKAGWRPIVADINAGPELHRYTYEFSGSEYKEARCIVIDEETMRVARKGCPQ